MEIFLGLLLGLIIGAGGAWVTASSQVKSSIERNIRDLDGRAKGAEASRDAAQKQAATFQQEIITLKSHIEKFQNVRIQLEGQVKALEAQKNSNQERINEYLKQISSLQDNNEHSRSLNIAKESQLNLTNEKLLQAQKQLGDSQKELWFSAVSSEKCIMVYII
ncbi:MAG: hypothetical protein VKJ02_18375 [Snowella sp.]|nr:hypothetical protein [Snowella sp.]